MFYIFGSPYERGFFCGDESIRYPFKESTVSSFLLHLIGLGLPTLVVSNILCTYKSLTLKTFCPSTNNCNTLIHIYVNFTIIIF